MFTWQEIVELFSAIGSNTVSLLSGVLGVVFTVISVWLPHRQKRYAFAFGIFALLLSPIYAWRDEYRAHRTETARLIDEKKTLTEQFQKDLKKLGGDDKFQRAMLRPNVILSFYYDADSAGWKWMNIGPGVGVVKWFVVSVDGVLQRNWPEAMRAAGIPWNWVSSFGIPYPDTPIAVNTSEPGKLLWFKPEQPIKLKSMGRVQLELCYCSLLDDCWHVTTRASEPPKTSTCKPEPKVIFGYW